VVNWYKRISPVQTCCVEIVPTVGVPSISGFANFNFQEPERFKFIENREVEMYRPESHEVLNMSGTKD